MSGARRDDVEIAVDGITLRGHLGRQSGPGPYPALLFTGPFTGVKEQVVGHYAELLSERGYVTLAFDHRNFGESDGVVRQHEDSAGKLADLRAATAFLADHPAVDETRIGSIGICLGGGYALKHAAFDPRVKALALVAAAFNDPRSMRSGMGAEAYRETMARLADVDQRQHDRGVVEYMPAVDSDGGEAAMPGREPWDYYGTSRAETPRWQNRVTRLSVRELLTFDAMIGADFVESTPSLVVHGKTDDFCSPADAQVAYDRLGGTKDLVWLDTTNHIDLYDQPSYVGPAVARVADWMSKHL
ncbi:MAG: alpha/beta hydrolase [Actinomycetia bacterium]|nr:alpha/beta hydrolase [Actinomycetes bacterium]